MPSQSSPKPRKQPGPKQPKEQQKRQRKASTNTDWSTHISAARAKIAANMGYIRKRYNLNDKTVPPDMLTRMQQEGVNIQDLSSPDKGVQARAGARLARMIERDRIRKEFGEDIGDPKPAGKPPAKMRDRSAAARKAALTRKLRGR